MELLLLLLVFPLSSGAISRAAPAIAEETPGTRTDDGQNYLLYAFNDRLSVMYSMYDLDMLTICLQKTACYCNRWIVIDGFILLLVTTSLPVGWLVLDLLFLGKQGYILSTLHVQLRIWFGTIDIDSSLAAVAGYDAWVVQFSKLASGAVAHLSGRLPFEYIAF